MHQATSDPGRVGEALRTLGYQLDMRVPAIGDPLPSDPHEHAATVIFGGPMSANDDHEDFIREETAFVDKLLAAERPYFGICLGAQIMARCLGADVTRHPAGCMEIGYYRVEPTEAGTHYFTEHLNAFQWHKEGFDLPRDCTLLATGDLFPNQAFRFGKKAYGIQFHPEVTEAMNRRWLKKASHMLVEPGAKPADQHLADRQAYDNDMRLWLDNFLQGWIGPTE
ncbi:GMP synthase [Sneathiella chinensis]|uniref:GMP synthase n=2 Tax=Sneathiella chinensis TaxID=349750 RepID=A0ABQ5U918_9PROT|nr:GMP synthase [Sneathiella chinensis]